VPAFYISPDGSDANNGTVDAPFATLTQAQAAMRASATVKTTYLRAGTYANVNLKLTSLDSGEVWSQYLSDGYGTAILDGGSSSYTTGGNPLTIDGASNVTINGFTIQNSRDWAIGIHGGPGDTPLLFPTTTPDVSGVTISNNVINDGFSSNNLTGAAPIGGIFQDGQVTNSTFENNAISNQNGAAIAVVPYLSSNNPPNTYSGLTIKNNAVFGVCRTQGDCGAIYLVDRLSLSNNSTITNNFVRDYQSVNGGNPTRDVGIYLDEATQNVTITGNVIGDTANVVNNSASVQGTMATFLSSARNIKFTGNIIDLGTTARIVNVALQVYSNSYPAMTGNTISGNIFIGNWTGAQNSYGIGQGPYAYPAGGPSVPTTPTLTNNLYYNYGAASMSTTGNDFSDTAPIKGTNPMISGTTYTLASNSPTYSLLTGFLPIAGGWGPPGYVIPSGTAPSYTGVQ